MTRGTIHRESSQMPQSEASDFRPATGTPTPGQPNPAPARGAVDAATSKNDMAPRTSKRRPVFERVYRPVLLTMLGVMVYLREGWVVGHAGLFGALLVILITFLISGAAAATFSSALSNARERSGGVLSALSQALGLEPAVCVAVPMVLGQVFAGALFLYGFAEAWGLLFPGHPPMAVGYVALLAVLAATLAPERSVLRLHLVVLILVASSLGAILLGATGMGGGGVLHSPVLWGPFDEVGFWLLFAVFFAAGTGIELGAKFSASVEISTRDVSRGTLAAVATAFVIYLIMAVWFSLVASSVTLRADPFVAVLDSAWRELVVAAMLAATLTAAVTVLTSAQRLLSSLVAQGALPVLSRVARIPKVSTEYSPVLAVGAMVALAMLAGGLDRVAVVSTFFFLLAFLALHGAVALQEGAGVLAYRPLLRVPGWVTFGGLALCIIALFAIDPVVALVGITLLGGLFAYLVRIELSPASGSWRSGILAAVAYRMAERTHRNGGTAEGRAWMPHLLVPVESREQLEGARRLLRLLAEPRGRISMLCIRPPKEAPPPTRRPTSGLADPDLFTPRRSTLAVDENESTPVQTSALDVSAEVETFRRMGLIASAATIEAGTLVKGTALGAEILRGSDFPPNVLFAPGHVSDQERLLNLAEIARTHAMGMALLYRHEEAGLGSERSLNVWVSDRSPSWSLDARIPNLDLALLAAYRIAENWNGRIRLCMAVNDRRDVATAEAFLKRIIQHARMPAGTEAWVAFGRFMEQLSAAPAADLQVIGLPRSTDVSFLKAAVRLAEGSCLFVRDSGLESAIA